MAVVVTATGFHVHHRPFAHRAFDYVEMCSLASSFITLWGGLFLGTPDREGTLVPGGLITGNENHLMDLIDLV